MTLRIQTFYPEAGLFLNTNHTSSDLEELKRLISSDMFLGFRVRIVDDNGEVMFAPPVRERASILSVSDIAQMLGVPIINDPKKFFEINGDDEDA